MTTTATTVTPGSGELRPGPRPPEVREAGGGLAADYRAIRVVWTRELIRFGRNRLRIVTALAQPILFLFILGTGLSGVMPKNSGFDYRTFMFPGILAMTVLFTAIFSAVSIVWDREFGFLREMLVAPVSRGALIVGKCLGGATVATIQATIMLAFAGAVGIPYSPSILLPLLGIMALTALAVTAVGILLASRMTQVESFQVVIQFFVMPMFFLSGAVFPLVGLPQWLQALTRIDPLTYAVAPMRHVIFSHLNVGPAARAFIGRGVTWFGWPVPIWLELVVLAVMAAVCLSVAAKRFAKPQ